jgi:hypothetical protein
MMFLEKLLRSVLSGVASHYSTQMDELIDKDRID